MATDYHKPRTGLDAEKYSRQSDPDFNRSFGRIRFYSEDASNLPVPPPLQRWYTAAQKFGCPFVVAVEGGA